MNPILKSLLLSLCCLILTALPVQAEEKSWYEIDGIKFRLGGGTQEIRFWVPGESIIQQDYDLEGQDQKRLFPVAIVFPETLMSSFSFRGAFFEYKAKTIANETAPAGWKNATKTLRRQSSTARTKLYNEFFNASEKSFVDANSNWALSADTEFMFVYLGYYWGIFLPIGQHHRFFKIAQGVALTYSDISVRLYLCSEYRISESEGKKYGDCVGKKEIDSGTVTGATVEPVFYFNLWERYSENSIWKFIQVNLNATGPRANPQYPFATLKYKNRNNTTFAEQPSTVHVEYISYTYRF